MKNKIQTDIQRVSEIIEAICARHNCPEMSSIINVLGRNISAVIFLLNTYIEDEHDAVTTERTMRALISSLSYLMNKAYGENAAVALIEALEICCTTLKNHMPNQTD